MLSGICCNLLYTLLSVLACEVSSRPAPPVYCSQCCGDQVWLEGMFIRSHLCLSLLGSNFKAWCSRVWKPRSSRQLIAHRATLGQGGTETWFLLSSLIPWHTGSRGMPYPDGLTAIVLSTFILFPPIKHCTFPHQSPTPKPLTLGSAVWSTSYILTFYWAIWSDGLFSRKFDKLAQFLSPADMTPFRLLFLSHLLKNFISKNVATSKMSQHQVVYSSFSTI